MGFVVQQSCPQCGAPVELDESDRMIECPYCEVRSIMSPTGYFRYVMHHQAPDKEIIYAPYLRFKGAVFCCQLVPGRKRGDVSVEIDNRMVDISEVGTQLTPLRKSLGVRTQTVKTHFPTPEADGHFLEMNIDSDEIIARAANIQVVKTTDFIPQRPKTATRNNISNGLATGLGAVLAGLGEDSLLDSAMNGFTRENPREIYISAEKDVVAFEEPEVFYHEIIGETLSIIYLPLYIEGDQLYDAIINEPLGKLSPEDEEVLRSATSDPKWKVNFLPIMCPNCGWDLQGRRNSAVYTCDNCHSAWESTGGKLKRAALLHISKQKAPASFLPFWRISAKCPSMGLETYTDLIKLEKPLFNPHAMDEVEETQADDDRGANDLHFIIPAFKTAPKVYLNAAERMTFTQRALPRPEAESDTSSICAVTMPREEAIQTVKIILASRAFDAAKTAAELPDAEIHVTDEALLYVPFNDSGFELSAQYSIPVSIIKQSLELVSDEQKQAPPVETLKPTIMCPLCGKEVPGGSMRCPYCGIGL